MPAPTEAEATEYLGDASQWTEDEVSSAFKAEKAAQSRACRVPSDEEAWPEDLTQALFRRVAVNLSVRNLPLGFDSSILETGAAVARVPGQNAEVRRLEAPHRRLVFG